MACAASTCEVVLVGETTCGKPYGFQRKDNCGYAFFPIEFQGFNAKNFGDYTTGFAPTCTVADDPDIALGTPEEPLLKAALSHVDTGSCPPGTASTSSRGVQSLDLRSASSRGFPPPRRAPVAQSQESMRTASAGMKPLASWPAASRRGISGVLTDIDDTLTTEGEVTADALRALDDLRAAGVHVIPITGRPVGWSEPFALRLAGGRHRGGERRGRAVAQARRARCASSTSRTQQARRQFRAHAAGRAAHRSRSAGRHAGARQRGARDRHRHRPQRIRAAAAGALAQVVSLMRDEGMNATVSSIHINGWFGDHNKLSGARWIVRELLGRELDEEIDRWVYVGDSTNDVLMFEHFPHSVGVANIRRFEAELSHPPALHHAGRTRRRLRRGGAGDPAAADGQAR